MTTVTIVGIFMVRQMLQIPYLLHCNLFCLQGFRLFLICNIKKLNISPMRSVYLLPKLPYRRQRTRYTGTLRTEIYPVGKKQKKVCEKSEKLPPNKLKGFFNNLLPDTKQTGRKTNSQKGRKSPVTGGEEQSIFDLEETMGIHP